MNAQEWRSLVVCHLEQHSVKWEIHLICSVFMLALCWPQVAFSPELSNSALGEAWSAQLNTGDLRGLAHPRTLNSLYRVYRFISEPIRGRLSVWAHARVCICASVSWGHVCVLSHLSSSASFISSVFSLKAKGLLEWCFFTAFCHPFSLQPGHIGTAAPFSQARKDHMLDINTTPA